jgi:hypothetical protein
MSVSEHDSRPSCLRAMSLPLPPRHGVHGCHRATLLGCTRGTVRPARVDVFVAQLRIGHSGNGQ